MARNMEGIARIYRAVRSQQAELDLEILKTVTGPRRERLTEANIHLMEAQARLADALDDSKSSKEAR